MRKSIEDGKVGLRMKEKITANLGLKIIACITAFVLWLVIINVDDPVKVAEFDNVEVTLINTDVITKNNKICEVLDNSNFITVKVYASRSVLDSIDASNIRAVADLSELADTIQVADTSNGNAYLDNVKIKLSTNKYNNDLNSISASADYVKVSIEDLKKVQKSIFVDLKGEPAEGYMVGKVSTASNLVRISGPASDVNLIDTVKVSADVTGFTDTISWDADIRLYDEKGNEIDGDMLLAIFSKYLKEKGKLNKNTLVATIMSNLGLNKFAESNNLELKQTKVGDRYVLEEMLKNGYNLGGEQSGHIIMLDYNPTGDRNTYFFNVNTNFIRKRCTCITTL